MDPRTIRPGGTPLTSLATGAGWFFVRLVFPSLAGKMDKIMNSEEVARRAKVSSATVSRVLNNASFVKNTTRTRVMKTIEELKYHPNLHARSLAGGKSRSIGVIVSNIENPFFLDIYKAVETGAHARGYEVIMANHSRPN